MADSTKSLGGYRLLEKVRTGPHLAVFASEDSLGRQIEVACYRASSLRDRTGLEAFLAEARQAASLHHENLCPMVNAGEDEGIWYAVSVAPDAPSVRELLDRGGALAPERVQVVAEKILAALGHLDGADLRHGDVRPETVFLSGGKVLLAPRRLIPLAPAERDLRYLSPEELKADGTDIRADLFAFGIVLFELLSGKAPSAATEPAGRLMEIEAGPADLPASVPEDLRRLVSALLAPLPDARPAGPAAAAGLLSGAVSPAPVAVVDDLAPPSGADLPSAAVAAPAPPRRKPGAFSWDLDGETATWEVFEERVHLSIEGGAPKFSDEEPNGAVAWIQNGAIHAIEGADPHPRVNGSLIDRHDLKAGDSVRLGDLELTWGPVRAEVRRLPPGAKARDRGRKVAIIVAFLLSIAVVGWGATRVLSALEADGDVLLAADQAEGRLSKESEKLDGGSTAPRAPGYTEKAKEAFEKAQEYARENPSEYGEIDARFRSVRKVYGPTAYAYLAQKELDDNSIRRREAEVQEFDALNKEVARAIEEDRLYDGAEMLENYEEHNGRTRFARRAGREALSLLETIAARFDEDMTRAERAAGRGEFGMALDILSIVRRYAGPDERARAERYGREIRKRIHETQVPGGETAGGPAPKDDKPQVPEGPGKDDPGGQDPVAGGVDETKAERILADVRRAFEREKWAEVLKLLEKLEEFAESGVVKRAVREIDRMRGLSRLEALGVAALFHGKTKIIKGLEVEISYDFSTADQAKDWFYTTPFASPMTGHFWGDHDALHARGVGAAVHPGEFESDSLELRARIRALEPHDFGFLMLEPEEQVNYFLYAVQNRFFVIKLDRPVHENSLWVVGKGAWADTPDGFLGMVRKNGSPDPAITAGEWVTLTAKKHKGTMSMVIKGKEIKGSAFGDNKYVFPGLQPAVYVIKGQAMFDDIVIRGTLKKEWVADRMRFLKNQFRKE